MLVIDNQKHDTTALKANPIDGWDRESMRRCWQFLDKTGEGYSFLVKELDGDLARTVCLFYLVLRGLDTIEDDMTIPDDVKQPILRKFHEHTVTPGWNFISNYPDEKDRQLLLEYAVVVDEVNCLTPSYKDIILDITRKMSVGMADYARLATVTGSIHIETISEFDLYCHYVGGLVVDGLSRVFSASGKESDSLGQELELSNSLAFLVHKADAIADYREDVDQRRYWWPREIWAKYGFTAMEEMYLLESRERALWAQTDMILDSLRHAMGALGYLKLLKNQSVFKFCASVVTLAVAALELCFMNPEMFQRKLKISKDIRDKLVIRSTKLDDVCLVFCEYIRKIHAKANPSDPNFIRISGVCSKIELWCEVNSPSSAPRPNGVDKGPTSDTPHPQNSIINASEINSAAELPLEPVD